MEEFTRAEPTNLAELMQSRPAVWTVLLGVGLAIGLILWILGSRLARKGVMLSGFVVGGLCAMAAASPVEDSARPPASTFPTIA